MSKTLYNNWKIDVKGCFKAMKRHDTYSTSYRKKEYDRGFFQPAVNFNKIIGIDVAEYYETRGLSIRDIQLILYTKYDATDWEDIDKLFDDLLSVNPSLDRFKYIKESKIKWDILFGIASLLNPDDIEFYIGDYEQLYKGQCMQYELNNKNFKKMYYLLSKFYTKVKINNIIGWIISPKTANYIASKIPSVYKYAPVAQLDRASPF